MKPRHLVSTCYGSDLSVCPMRSSRHNKCEFSHGFGWACYLTNYWTALYRLLIGCKRHLLFKRVICKTLMCVYFIDVYVMSVYLFCK